MHFSQVLSIIIKTLSTSNVIYITPDFNTLVIRRSDTQKIYIYHVHNFSQNGRHSSFISTVIDKLNKRGGNIKHILLGDCNFHHPLCKKLGIRTDENFKHFVMG